MHPSAGSVGVAPSSSVCSTSGGLPRSLADTQVARVSGLYLHAEAGIHPRGTNGRGHGLFSQPIRAQGVENRSGLEQNAYESTSTECLLRLILSIKRIVCLIYFLISNKYLTLSFEPIELRIVKRFSKRPMSDSKISLLKAAGSLFAERGIDGVSLREITQAAGANLAAVNYHFGSREGLVMNLVAMHLHPLWEERQMRLESAERKWGAKVIPLEELVDLWLRPLPGLMKRSVLGEAVSLGVTGRMMMMAETEHPAELRAVMAVVTQRFLKALAKTVPGVDVPELAWRLDWVHGALARLLAGPWGANGTPLTQLDAVCASFVRFAAAGFREGASVVAVNRGAGQGPQETFDF